MQEQEWCPKYLEIGVYLRAGGKVAQGYSSYPISYKEWIMEQWEKNYYISAIAGENNGSSLVVMSKAKRQEALLEERPGTNNFTIAALMSVKWKEPSEEEKQEWKAKAAEAMEAYKKELEEYKNSIAAAIDDNQ
ncbi:hypothetical protein Q3G72_016388 [Acer saccharum]|nr:hypothetical protein Q3G72_016388 [Acer saccharum]